MGASASESSEQRDRVVALIALFRLTKALLLILAGFGVLELLNPAVAAHVRDWMRSYPLVLRYHPERALTARHIEYAAAGAFAYAALFIVEGTGLWLQKRWAHHLTIVATTSFIPFEVMALVDKVTVLRVSLLLANVAIVIYLLRRLRRQHRPGRVAR